MAVIKIVSKKEGFWRMGICHSRVAHLYLAKELGSKLPALKAEPMLEVSEVPEENLMEEIAGGAVATFEYDQEPESTLPNFEDMKVEELKKLAEEYEIDLNGATKKAEIIEAIKIGMDEFLTDDD